MLAFGMWDVFGWVGIVTAVILALHISSEIQKGRSAKNTKERHRISVALRKAADQSLEDATQTLEGVGMSYHPGVFNKPAIWNLPGSFWRVRSDYVDLKAKALITLIRNAQAKRETSGGLHRGDLTLLLKQKVKRHPGLVLALTFELACHGRDLLLGLDDYLDRPGKELPL